MTVQTAASQPLAASFASLRSAVPALVVGLVLIGLMFREEAIAAIGVWEASTAYSHCYFVLPIAFYLAWDRRHMGAGVPVVPLPWVGLLAAPMLIAWLAAERMGIMEGRQIVVIGFVQVLFLAVLGWRLYWVFSAALLYLFFLVPFGAFLTPALQRFTLEFSLIGLDVLGIPFYADEFLIDIPAGRFYVAEACAGLRFLIASIAFGVLYACLIYRSPARRAAFIVASIIIPIVANGFRALGIVVLGHYLGSAEAAATDHVLYGWVFFSIVILLLILAGMPFREDNAPEAPPPAPPAVVPSSTTAMTGGAIAAAVVLFFAGAGSAVAAWLDGRAAPPATVPALRLVDAAGCRVAGSATELSAPQTGLRRVHDFTCGPLRLSMTMQVFPARANHNRIVATRRDLGREFAAEEIEMGSLPVEGGTPASWRLAINKDPAVMAATTLYVEGAPSRGGLGERILQARNSVVGASAAPVLLALELHFIRNPLSPIDRERAQILMSRFIASQPDLAGQVGAIATAAATGPGG